MKTKFEKWTRQNCRNCTQAHSVFIRPFTEILNCIISDDLQRCKQNQTKHPNTLAAKRASAWHRFVNNL